MNVKHLVNAQEGEQMDLLGIMQIKKVFHHLKNIMNTQTDFCLSL